MSFTAYLDCGYGETIVCGSTPVGEAPDDLSAQVGLCALPLSGQLGSGGRGAPDMSRQHVLALDQGTTSSRAIVFDREGRNVGMGQKELRQHFPKDGWVEHDPEDIWRDTLAVCHQAIAAAGVRA